ncbi:ribonuclease P protein component, partial [Acinetobacter baumannii]
MDAAVFKASQGSFLLLARPSESGNSRIGFIIAKKKVRLAVDRNRIKRCVRDDFRLMNSELPAMDIVFLARQDLSVIDNMTLHDNC